MGKMPIATEDPACLNKQKVFTAFLKIKWKTYAL